MSSSGRLCISRVSQYKKLRGEGNVLLTHDIKWICQYHASLRAIRGLSVTERG